MAEKLQQILDSLNWFVPKSLPWFCQIRENVSVHGLHTSNNWGSRFFCGFSGSQRHVTSKVSRDCSFLHFSPLIYLKGSSSLSEAFLLGIALVRLHQINLNLSCVQLLVNSWLLWTAAFILCWHPGPYFPYHLIFNRPQPAWDCLSMPGCFDLHSILWSLIWSEKLFILDPFPAVFPSLLSPFDFAHKHRDNSRLNDRKYTSYLSPPKISVLQKKLPKTQSRQLVWICCNEE